MANAPLKTNTRLITVDVVATDSHGNAVRGLTENDFEVYLDHGVQQDIARFKFVDARMRQLTVAKNAAPGEYSNLNAAGEQATPIVLLMDALNTDTDQQMTVRRQMALFLEKLPPKTPVAVLLLGHSLRVVQNFTTDPATLRAALQSAVSPTTNEKYPKYNPDSLSNLEAEAPKPREGGNRSPGLKDSEKRSYEAHIRERANETADGMKAIAKYLGGFPERKNLIWFSEAFPTWIEPNPGFGNDPFAGTGSYQSQVQAAAASLMDAGVSVYPADARGSEPPQAYSADARPAITEHTGAGFAAAPKQENDLRMNSQATLRRMAYDTGGRACENTNDLAGCVSRALNEDSSYYEISFYPTNVNWDNRFHKISIRTSKRGVHLNYRRGFIAMTSSALTKNKNAGDFLKEACSAPVPLTTIGMTVTALPLNAGQTGARYLLTISPNALTVDPEGQSFGIDVQMAICEYNPKGDQVAFYSRDLSEKVPASEYDSWKQNGMRDVFGYAAKPQDRRLRLAVVDLPSGETGSVDVPAHPTEFGVLPPGTSAPSPSAVASPASAGSNPQSGAAGTISPPTHLDFRLPSGKSGTLDWSTGKLTYKGDFDSVVPALFKTIYGSKFHCDSGKLLPNQPNGGSPTFQLSFRSPSGLTERVDFGGSVPVYTGELPVDASAKAFFALLWK